jgi:hypothetical protein
VHEVGCSDGKLLVLMFLAKVPFNFYTLRKEIDPVSEAYSVFSVTI